MDETVAMASAMEHVFSIGDPPIFDQVRTLKKEP
jgi:hypothetical protein